ncbi:hypothetical protein AMJ86_04005 [bacterium SM23_57]|nr:MAG: hypothetical protein AMJ86_04005 [bacterium SM23_57]
MKADMTTRRLFIGWLLVTILLTTYTTSYAFLDYTGNNLGLGRSHSLFDRGAWVGRWNPSLLDRSGSPAWSMRFLSFGLLVGNNTLSRNDYQRLFTGGSIYWDSEDKEEILGEIPGDRLRVYFLGNATGLGVSMNRFALNVQAIGAGRAAIPKDFITLALYGNELHREYKFDAIEGLGWGAVSTEMSIGKQLSWHYFDEFAVGATFRYLYGMFFDGITKSDGGVIVTENGATGRGDFEVAYSKKGDGVGLDIAASALWNEKWEFGITVGNLVGNITWDLDSVNVYGFDVTSGEVDIDSLDDEEYLDRLFNQVDTTYSGGTTKTRLPFYIQLNAGRRINDRLFVTGEYRQGFVDKPGISKNPRITVAGEYRVLPWLPVRSGIAVGGSFNFEFGGGFGLDFGNYTFDFGIVGLKGFFGSSHGVGIGVTNRLVF